MEKKEMEKSRLDRWVENPIVIGIMYAILIIAVIIVTKHLNIFL